MYNLNIEVLLVQLNMLSLQKIFIETPYLSVTWLLEKHWWPFPG